MKALVFSTASDRLPRRLHTIPLSRGPRARQTLQAYSDTHYQQRKNTSRPSIRDDPRGSGCPSPPVQHRPAGGNRFFLEMRDYPQILLPEVLSSIGDSFLAGGSARLVFLPQTGSQHRVQSQAAISTGCQAAFLTRQQSQTAFLFTKSIMS